MGRHHLAVALVPPARLADRIDTLRRAIRSTSLDRIPPHLTLVPPVNVRDEAMDAVERILDEAATATTPFELRIGPADTFAPSTPTLHLDVRGVTTSDDEALRRLRDRLLLGPLDRPEAFPFVPHVTLAQRLEADRIDAAVPTLDGVDEHWEVGSLHLLEHVRPEDRTPYWRPAAEVPFGAPHLVGRGGIELRIRATTMLGREWAAELGVPEGAPEPRGGATPLVVTAARGDERCGVAVGELLGSDVARLTAVVVAPSDRRLGIGAHLLAAWSSAAAERGAATLLAGADECAGFLERHGFVAVGDVMVRR